MITLSTKLAAVLVMNVSYKYLDVNDTVVTGYVYIFIC